MKSAIISLLFLTKQSLSSGGDWDYDHMDHWVDDYSMCNNQDESPIDIISSTVIYDETICTADFDWEIDYTKHTFTAKNNGHTISLRPIEETTIDPDGNLEGTLFNSNGTEYIGLTLNENTIASFPNYFQPEHSEHSSFCLDSLHFHWGTSDRFGSEHFVDGHQYPLEIHFVHYSCHHTSLSTTLDQFPLEENVTHMIEAGEDTHQLGVVGIFFDVVEDESNPAFDAIFEHLEELESPDLIPHIITGLDLTDLIPQDVSTAGYYAYEGSLTTPPCTDIVRWHVMNARGWIGSDQMDHFRELLASDGHQIAPNYREVQHNINDVYGCMEALEDVVVNDSVARGAVWALAVITLLTPVIMGFVCIYQNRKEKRMATENVKTVKN